MADDVDDARELLTSTLNAAFEAAHEHKAALNATSVEELALWESIGALVVPAFDAECLQAAAVAIDEPALAELLAARDETRRAQQECQASLAASLLETAELDQLGTHRLLLDAQLTIDRGRYKEMRSRRGLLDRVDEMRKGARLKGDVLALVNSYEELRLSVQAQEGELSRLATVAARHHRARIQLAELDDQLAAFDAGSLRDARCLVVDRLLRSGPPWPSQQLPALASLFRCLEGVCAKRKVLDAIYDSWLRPHGAVLIDLQQQGISVSGFETVSWPAKVELRCRDVTIALDAWRRAAAGVVAFVAYDEVLPSALDSDWWSALVPGVPNPDGPVTETPPRDLAQAASEKLAAAWATLASPAVEADIEPPASLPMEAFRQPIPGFDDEAPNPFAAPDLIRVPVGVANLGRLSFAPGSTVGRCVVDALIGRGGRGEVYRGRLQGELGFSRTVVLKRLSVDPCADSTQALAVAQEAARAARIAHPNVVQILDIQSVDNEPFIVMEFLEGLTIKALVSRAQKQGLSIDPAVVVRCAIDAARGLQAAHSLRDDDGVLVGLVHRAVSPEKLFLCHNGFTKLLDLGIARPNDLTTMTGRTDLKGKISDMSPEQITGDPLDARSDLFSLGATLYWMLSGHKPFVGDNEIATIYAVVHKPHPPLRSLRADAGVLTDVVEQLLQKRRDDRPSALTLIDLLQQCRPASPEDAATFLSRVREG